jgi:phosphatidylinositol alpha-1,6-mannosyltransferase
MPSGSVKPRLAVLITDAFATPGGVQSVNRNLARALSACPDMEAEYFSLLDPADEAADPRYFPHSRFRAFGGSRLRFAGAVILAFLSRGYAGILIMHRNLFPLAIVWQAVSSRPYLVFIHGVEIWERQPVWHRMALLGARRVLANSRFTADRASASNGLSRDRVQVIPLCLDELRITGGPEVAPSRDAAPVLLTVGRADRGEGYKGQETVIRAMPRILAEYPTVRYAMVGGGDDEARLRQLSQALHVEQSVDFLGALSDEERNARLGAATIFVMPSRGEGFGVVYLEAMNYRLPCIAGDSDGGREPVRDGINGFTVDAASPVAVADAVCRLLSDAPLRSSMGEAGRRLIETEYSFANFSRSITGAIERVIIERVAAEAA